MGSDMWADLAALKQTAADQAEVIKELTERIAAIEGVLQQLTDKLQGLNNKVSPWSA
jgi:uncharacterized coiled-coil protein SlyX